MKNYRKVLSIFLALVFMGTMSPTAVYARTLEFEGTIENGNTVKYTQLEREKVSSFKGKDNSAAMKDKLPAKTKSKLDTNLLKLTNKQSLGLGESKDSLKAEMKLSNQLISKGDSTKFDKTTAPEDMVFVYIKTKTPEGLNKVEPYTFNIENKDVKNKLMAAWVEIDKLEQLELLDEVWNVSMVTKPKVNVTSEGDNLHRAKTVRGLTNGTIGNGVKVGVISDGVDTISWPISQGELPPQIQYNILSNQVHGDEGTAMLEIVHDLAPGAELYFHDCGSNNIGFNSAVDDLVAAGCQIIVDDIGWFNEPYFEEGIISSHISQVVNTTGISYISSAGNSAGEHYQGTYCNDGSNWHDFSSGKSSYKDIYVKVQPGEHIQAFLQWDDPFENSTNDYDLYMANISTGEILDYSNGTQEGNAKPFEVSVYYNNTSSIVNVAIGVNNPNGSAQAKNLELYVWGNCYLDNIVASDSIFGQPAAPEVIAAGAINVSSPNAIANYSSQGPVTTRSGAVRNKPDICGAAGVSVTGAGGFPSPFYGTSAAAPHIAAITALMRAKYPTKTGKEIRDLIQNNAVDLGASGFDTVFGYGRADAYNAFMAGGPGEGIAVTGVSLNKTTLNMAENRQYWFIPTVAPAEATNKSVTWKSSDDSVVKVDPYGRIESLRSGTATITVTTVVGGYSASCQVTVGGIQVSSVSLIPNLIMDIGDESQLKATVLPENAVDKTVEWSSSNKAVATVDSNGVVRGIAGGTATISASASDGVYGTCQVYVHENSNIIPIRYAGGSRFETAVKVSMAGWQTSENVVLVNAYGFADALTGVPFAYQKDAPILLTEANALPAATSYEMKRLGAKNVYILGGTGVVSQGVENQLRNYGMNVYRLAGASRFETALQIGSEVMKNNTSKTAVLTTAYNYPDALAISSYAAMNYYPILYTAQSTLNEKTREFIVQNGITKIIIPGGIGAVSEEIANELRGRGIEVERISGTDRYNTALNIVKKYSSSYKNDIMVATGTNFPDALAGGVLAAKLQLPILLVERDSARNDVIDYIREHKNSALFILGGTGVISEELVKKIVN